MRTVTATEIQNNFGKYLQLVQSGEEICVLKNGKEVARIISREKSVSFLSDSLLGIPKNDYGYYRKAVADFLHRRLDSRRPNASLKAEFS